MTSEKYFKSLADETRLRCLSLLLKHGELCVCELNNSVNVSQPKISRHLAFLKKAGIVTDRKEGLWVRYKISSELPEWVIKVIKITVDAAEGTEPFISDEKRLKDFNDGRRCGCV